MLFRLPIVRFFNRILNRITVTVVLVALQLAWLAWVFFALTTGAARVWVTGVLNGLSLLIILYLVRKDENSAYKVTLRAMNCGSSPPSIIRAIQ